MTESLDGKAPDNNNRKVSQETINVFLAVMGRHDLTPGQQLLKDLTR